MSTKVLYFGAVRPPHRSFVWMDLITMITHMCGCILSPAGVKGQRHSRLLRWQSIHVVAGSSKSIFFFIFVTVFLVFPLYFFRCFPVVYVAVFHFHAWYLSSRQAVCYIPYITNPVVHWIHFRVLRCGTARLQTCFKFLFLFKVGLRNAMFVVKFLVLICLHV